MVPESIDKEKTPEQEQDKEKLRPNVHMNSDS